MKRRFFLAGAAMAFLSACASKFRSYNGPAVTRVVVNKGERRMYLLHNDMLLKTYKVDLGFAPNGHKLVKGDGKTPEGSYIIDRRNPRSAFHLSLGISYPNEADVARAKSFNMDPGGDIFIHGGRRKQDRKGPDWTWGCISVSNREMEDIYAMVRDGTQVDIHP